MDILSVIAESGLFDSHWYASQTKDPAASLIDYLSSGWLQGLNPSPKFDGNDYLARYPDVAGSGMSPLAHFVLHGKREGRVFSPVRISCREEIAPLDQSVVQLALPVSGDFNLPKDGSPIVRGWAARIGDRSPCVVDLRVDSETFQVFPSIFRRDLLENGVNEGCHGFEWSPPIKWVDGQEHELELREQGTGKILAVEKVVWTHTRRFDDFSGLLREAWTNPLIPAPFREEDIRCFSTMVEIEQHFARKALQSLKKPLVSLIVPFWNRAHTLHRAISSALQQSYSNFELLVINDGSEDDSVSVLRSFNDPRIILLELAGHEGVSSARNAGLRAAKGEYIFYLDSDNDWSSNHIATLLGAMLDHPDVSAAYSAQLLYVDGASQPYGVRYGAPNINLLNNRNYIDLNCFCHRRSILDQVGKFDEELKRFVDWDLILRVSEVAKIMSVPAATSNYYFGAASNTITGSGKWADQALLVQAKALTRRQSQLARRHLELTRPVSIVIPSYEALEELKLCLSSIEDSLGFENITVIVVDNASSKAVADFLRELKFAGNFIVELLDQNYGFTHAVNIGIGLADPQSDIVLLNNDAALAADCIFELQQWIYSLPECALAVPAQILPASTPTISTHVPFADPDLQCDVNLSGHHRNVLSQPIPVQFSGPVEISFAPFFCVYIPRETIDKAGPLNAGLGRHYRSDRIYSDYCRHILQKRMFYIPSAHATHLLQRSTQSLLAAAGSTATEDNLWGGWTEAERSNLGFSRPWWE